MFGCSFFCKKRYNKIEAGAECFNIFFVPLHSRLHAIVTEVFPVGETLIWQPRHILIIELNSF